MFRLPRFSRLATLLGTAPLAALVFSTGCTCGEPYSGDYYDADRPDPVQNINFVESEKGEPKVVGCADGQREGFSDLDKHARIAGCVGKWDGAKSLRDKPTGKACGDDGDKCAVPADLCAEGWHVCGTGGRASDLSDRADVAGCHNAGPGRFNAAMSHSPTDEVNPCPTIRKSTILPCESAGLGAEPVCCGNDCLYGKCKDAVFPGKTKISRGTTEGCGAVTSERNGGVMCCFSGEGNPADAVAAKAEGEAAEGEEAKAEGEAAEGEEAKAEGEAAEGEEAKAEGEAEAAHAKGEDAKAEELEADAKAAEEKPKAKAG